MRRKCLVSPLSSLWHCESPWADPPFICILEQQWQAPAHPTLCRACWVGLTTQRCVFSVWFPLALPNSQSRCCRFNSLTFQVRKRKHWHGGLKVCASACQKPFELGQHNLSVKATNIIPLRRQGESLCSKMLKGHPVLYKYVLKAQQQTKVQSMHSLPNGS